MNQSYIFSNHRRLPVGDPKPTPPSNRPFLIDLGVSLALPGF